MSLADLWTQAWSILSRGVADRKAPARHPVLATTSSTHGAQARVVVLRKAVQAPPMLEIHTDTLSGKVSDLKEDPRASLLVWAPKASIQLRLRVAVSVEEGSSASEQWHRVPDGSRQAYGGTPPPGHPIASPEDFSPNPTVERFAVLRCDLVELDMLHLASEGHRRALYRAADNFKGQWIAP